jgi:hypothetical protein
MKNIFFKIAKRSVLVSWWSILAAVLLLHFCYYGVFPSNST